MENQSSARSFGAVRLSVARFTAMVLCLFATFWASAASLPLTIKVIGVAADGKETEITTDYRWTVEEDATKPSVPGLPATKANYSFSFHTSYMPVVAAGRVGTASSKAHAACAAAAASAAPRPAGCDPDVYRLYTQTLPSLDDTKRYYVSVAAEGFQMGGAPVVFGASAAAATVYVNQYNLPTAQVSVFAFEDNNPINGAPDLPQETGLAGFTVVLNEAGGTYGQSGGAVTQDAFGNPLGTTYSDDQGTVLKRGNGIILTGPDGTATIKNLFPAKYTVVIVPPVGSDWHQTSTIEGTRGQDAWVKNNEPSFFQEYGPPGHHVFIGFTRSGFLARNANNAPVLNGTRTITGRIVNIHNSRPPEYTFFNGAPVPECWVGLNETNGGTRALYATACRKDSTFTIPNVPNGTYELVVWDDPLDMIIGTTTVTVNNANVAMGDVPVFSWFARYQGRVFQDIDGTGLPYFAKAWDRPYIEVDPVTGVEREVTKHYNAGDLKPPFGEGIANNIRFRDGSIYQSVTTKKDGTFSFNELFPFFNWMIAEIDYARFKATGATMVTDAGGSIPVVADPNSPTKTSPDPSVFAKLWKAETGLYGSNDPAFAYNPFVRLNPQAHPCSLEEVEANTNSADPNGCTTVGQTRYFRQEQGVVLLEGMQTFLGQTNHIEWGKQPYAFNENGGIAGIVHYAITRAEDDPRFAAAENWEPGIPHVQVNLYLDCDGDGIPDKPLNDGTGQCVAGAAGLSSLGYQYKKPDVDNFPFCWSEGSCPKGPEDVVNSGDGITFSEGDVFKWGAGDNLAVGIGTTDSWDDKIPTGCPKSTSALQGGNGGVTSPVIADLDCFDGLYNFNQLRAAVFDGGYAFGRVAGQAELPMLIGAEGKGKYIVEAVAPPGYLHQGNGDKNVVFGDQLKSAPAALPFECVGELLDVPPNLTLFPGEPNPNYGSPQYPNNKWRKCDMKAVPLVPGTNPAPDFYMFTEAPVAGHGVGFILDDTASEFNRFAPTFGEKYAPPHLPVSVQDWTGREITRVYSDQFGSYNFLVPSSFTINPPYPSGVMPSMMVSCMNHPGPITDERPTINGQPNPTFGQKIIDPFFNRKYTQFCYTLQYLPGKTTYLDTPVLPIAAFASVEKNPLDCECQDGTPAIYSATNGDNGPWLPSGGGVLTIVSTGSAVEVANPAYDPTDPASPKLITRDYGFGSTSGTVRIGSTTLSLASAWSKDGVAVNVPAGVSGQLSVTRGDNGKESVVGLTVHSGNPAPRKVNAGGVDAAGCGLGASLPCKTIQRAIDESSAANNTNTLITVAPGTYNEYVIVDKRVRLQGWGSGSVAINASKASAGGLAAWRALLNKKVDARCGTPNGSTDTAHCPANTPIDPDTGNPTIVAGNDRTFDPLPGQTLGINSGNNEPLLFGAEEGPGILVVGRGNGNGTNCANTNSALRIDGLTVTGSDAGGGILASGYACNLQITNNRVVANYGTYGGGIRVGHTDLVDGDVFTDAVNRNVSIHHNWVAENGATESGGGGGITMGTGSTAYQVTDNYVCGNFSMSDGGGVSHWGVSNGTIAHNRILLNQTFFQGGNPTGGGVFVGGQAPVGGGDSPGTGNVTVDANLIQYNNAGAGAGGGMSIARTATGDALIVTNNMIVNNASGFAGGGVALAEIRGTGVRLVNNTIADNASTATNQESFPAGPKVLSTAQIAGVALRPGAGTSTPTLLNNIVWGNRSYRWSITPSNPNQPQTTVLTDAGIWDLGVVGNASHTALASIRSIVTEAITAGAATCTNCSIASASQLAFLKPITFTPATDPDQPGVLPETTVMQTALTFDEGGNFINVIFSPLTPWDITAGPTFGSARADYHIDDGSVAVNAGEDRTAANRVPTTDHDGESRPVTGVDIGADELPIRANLAVTITDNRTTVTPGTTGVTYVIVVTNSGPTAVTGATLSDALPGAARLAVTSWTCAASAGSSCTTGGSGNSTRSGLMNLAINGTVTYTVVGNVPAGAPAGASTNTVTVAPPAGVTDPNPANNTASDTDTILAPAASLSTILLNFGDVATGATATSVVTMSNTGTAPLTITSAVVSGTRFGKGADSCTGVSVAPGNSCTVAVTFNPNNGLPRIGALTFTDNAGTQAVVLTGI